MLFTAKIGLEAELRRLEQSFPEVKALEEELSQQKAKREAAEGELQARKNQLETNPKDPNGQVLLNIAASRRDTAEISYQSVSQRLGGRRSTDLQTEMKGKMGDIDKINRDLAEIQKQIIMMMTPEQEFKKSTSSYFTLLIGAVIVGFFVLAFSDHYVRRAIFSGQAGIQFVTLFSLVIAIILFGVTGILEGKELSALLGGLSGYILGRVNQKEGSGGAAVPGVPKGLKVTSSEGSISINAACNSVAEASSYTWYGKVAGKDADFVVLSTTAEPRAVLANARFVVGDDVAVQVSASNSAGTGEPSKPANVKIA